MRADKQLCTTDPTGVLGCLPGSAGTQPTNVLSSASMIASSQQGMSTVAGALGPFLGLYNLQTPLSLPAGYVDPTGARQVNTGLHAAYGVRRTISCRRNGIRR